MAVATEELLKSQIIRKAWEDKAFKQHLLDNPKAALKEAFGIEVPDHISMTAVEETSRHFYLVIPDAPSKALEVSSSPASMW